LAEIFSKITEEAILVEILCEKDVEYLFCRFHPQLGFEKVLSYDSWFPDVIALRDGIETRIELEYFLSRIWGHYIEWELRWRVGYFTQIEGVWKLFIKDLFGYDEYYLDREFQNPDNLFLESSNASRLMRKSLRPYLDVIICWKIGNIPLIMRKDPYLDDIEIIELSSKLKELNRSW